MSEPVHQPQDEKPARVLSENSPHDEKLAPVLGEPVHSPHDEKLAPVLGEPVHQPLYEQLARIGKAAASPHRLHILDLLAQGEKSVESLAEEAGLSVKNASAHLRVLRGARLVDSRKSAQFCFYRLADESVASFGVALRDLAERRLAEVREFAEEFLNGRDRMTAVDRRRLLSRIRKGEVVALDVRPSSEFEAGHIPGARSVPLAELEKALSTIPKDQEIVAYCRGPYCGLSEKAAAMLRSRGYRAISIHDGIVDWKESGLPVARSAQRPRAAQRL